MYPEFSKFAEQGFRWLERFEIEPDLQKLEHYGVQKETLAVAVTFINVAQGLDDIFRRFGDKRSRQRLIKQLLAPIATLKELDSTLGSTMKKFPPTIIASPDLLISNLERFANMLTWADALKETFRCNSFLELAKFGFAGLVKRVTNKYLDREVSALTGAALRPAASDTIKARPADVRSSLAMIERSDALYPKLYGQ